MPTPQRLAQERTTKPYWSAWQSLIACRFGEIAYRLTCFSLRLFLSLFFSLQALLSAVNAARLFSRVFDLELEPETVKERKQNPVLKVRGPMALGQALRVTGEIKLQMGAVESARKDLADSFKLQKRIKEPMLSFYFTGSRLGQADVLWSLAEAALTCGNFEVAKNLANSCLVIYEDLSSSIGLGMVHVTLPPRPPGLAMSSHGSQHGNFVGAML